VILDTLDRWDWWGGLHPRLREGLEFLRATDLSRLAIGRHSVDGEKLLAIVDKYRTRPASQCRLEAHQRYHDIQHIIAGRERIGYAPLRRVRLAEAYDAAGDVGFYEGEYDMLTLDAGMFAIFAPHDAHAPQMMIDRPEPVRKIVVKVQIERGR
jgi:biofilm protein TabA